MRATQEANKPSHFPEQVRVRDAAEGQCCGPRGFTLSVRAPPSNFRPVSNRVEERVPRETPVQEQKRPKSGQGTHWEVPSGPQILPWRLNQEVSC